MRLVETVADQVGAALRSASLYEQLERAYLGTAQALVAALEAKDAYTAEHARSIVEQAEKVGIRLGLDDADLRDLRFAAVFHDIGKIGAGGDPHQAGAAHRRGARRDGAPPSASRSSRRSSSSPACACSCATSTSAGTAPATPTGSPERRSRSARGSSSPATRCTR